VLLNSTPNAYNKIKYDIILFSEQQWENDDRPSFDNDKI
jgi:hypothetical protein